MTFAYEWFRFERLMVAARCLGAAGRLVDEMTAFAAARVVGGQPISEYGLVAGMLADSLTELFAARALVYETARGIDRLRVAADVKVSHAQCSMAKLYASEMAGRVADRAVQVFGGRGYMRENVAERFFRELRVERIWEGTSEIQRMIIARQMTKRTPAALA
jgi:acyl-CoA dehydrogenase